MNTYKMQVVLEVELEAMDEADACDLVEENFGEGDFPGGNICEMNMYNIREA